MSMFSAVEKTTSNLDKEFVLNVTRTIEITIDFFSVFIPSFHEVIDSFPTSAEYCKFNSVISYRIYDHYLRLQFCVFSSLFFLIFT